MDLNGEPVGEHLKQGLPDLIFVGAGVDDGVAVRALAGLLEIALAHAGVKLAAFGFHAIEQGVEPRGGGRLVDVEDDDQVGLEPAGGDLGDGENVGRRQPAGGALIGKGGTDEAVGEDGAAGVDGRSDEALDQLGSAGHVEQHFAAHAHRLVVMFEEDGADVFADDGAAGLADLARVEPALSKFGDQTSELGGLAGAVRPVEDDEDAGEARGDGREIDVLGAHRCECKQSRTREHGIEGFEAFAPGWAAKFWVSQAQAEKVRPDRVGLVGVAGERLEQERPRVPVVG